MTKMDWERAKTRDRMRRYGSAPVQQTEPPKRKAVNLTTVFKTCTVCSQRKNGHHFTTVLGKAKTICASCAYKIAQEHVPTIHPKRGRRRDGTNSRAQGTNPRAQGTNPRVGWDEEEKRANPGK